MELNLGRDADIMFDHYGNEYGMNGMWVFWLFGLVLLVGIVLLVIFAVRAGGGFGRRADSALANDGAQPLRRDNPRQVLDHRYARGELDTAEYRERVQALAENV